MTKVSNLFLMIVAAALLLYAGAKGYLYYTAQNIFENMRIQTALFGDLNYDDISTALPGKIVYEGVRLATRSGSETIAIKALTLETPELDYLLKALISKDGRTKAPEQFRLSAEGAMIDLNGPLMERVDQFFAAQLPEKFAGELICDKSFLGPAQYRTLGYKILKSNISVDYRYYESDFSITTNIKLNIEKVANTAISVRIKNALPLDKMERVASTALPTLSRIELLLEDKSYTERVNQYCANLKEMSVDDYIIAVTNQSSDYYLEHWGFVPGSGIRWAYRTFLTNPGKARIIIRPPEPLDMKSLVHYAARDLPDILGLNIEVNGQPVNDLTIIAIAKPGDNNSPSERSQSQTNQDSWKIAADAAYKNNFQEVIANDYQRVELSDLRNHLGKKIRIFLDHGGIREGWLAAATAAFLKIEQRLRNNSISMLVELEHIDHVEVLSTTDR